MYIHHEGQEGFSEAVADTGEEEGPSLKGGRVQNLPEP